ncbi:hypothetical protein PQ469_27795 [Mucilaginibacter sp. KACC 22773]|uniref:hypothetical protein n=1 Tax=Mucilaginibacter sp. KACC 22773 TaxID=3025671 RepID=UPI00236646EA|nr:hypothetical protein [Mucilaginibacter sp. KACC 22773]WDF77697.1 hypothetical protein PQ469_27795 [Mucilaginibacter sp. KACC 22773]
MSKTTPENLLLSLFNLRWSDFAKSKEEQNMPYDFKKVLIVSENKELKQLINSKQKLQEINKIRIAKAEFEELVLPFNQKKGKSALRKLIKLDRMVENDFHCDSYLYLKQWSLSVWGLYYYKNRSFEKAKSKLIECIALNEYLISKGLKTAMFRIFEQNLNLSSIYIQEGRITEGLCLKKHLLQYLADGKPNKVLISRMFRDEDLYNSHIYIREGCLYQLFRKMAAWPLHNRKDPYDDFFIFRLLFDKVKMKENTNDREIMKFWIYIKRNFHQENYENYKGAFAQFMNISLSYKFDVLKVSLISDILQIIESSKFESKNDFYSLTNAFISEKLIGINDFKSHFIKRIVPEN